MQPDAVKTLNENSETFMLGDSPHSRHNFLLVFKKTSELILTNEHTLRVQPN